MTTDDVSGAVKITNGAPRWVAPFCAVCLVGTVAIAVLANKATWPVIAFWLIIVGAPSIWAWERTWRMGLRLGDDGVIVRNFGRTRRLGWHEVSSFTDGFVQGADQHHNIWVLMVVLRDGRVIRASGTKPRGGLPGSETLEAICQAAERHRVTTKLTGTVPPC